MKNFRLCGKIRETESGNGIPDLIIEVKDADLFIDELITTTKSGRDGLFETAFLSACRDKPDIYLNIKTPDGRLVASTCCDFNTDEESNSEINLNISRCSRIAGSGKELSRAGLADKSDKLTSWTFLPDKTS